jgi:hypothetical protein
MQVSVTFLTVAIPFLSYLTYHPPNVIQSVEHWKKFFADSDKYHKIGRVLHRPIDPSSPIPEHCDEEKRREQKAQADAKRPRKAEL